MLDYRCTANSAAQMESRQNALRIAANRIPVIPEESLPSPMGFIGRSSLLSQFRLYGRQSGSNAAFAG
jgi:hypothetical protein